MEMLLLPVELRPTEHLPSVLLTAMQYVIGVRQYYVIIIHHITWSRRDNLRSFIQQGIPPGALSIALHYVIISHHIASMRVHGPWLVITQSAR